MLKQINSANPGTRRPFRIQDLQDLWDGLNVLHCEDFAGTRILFGFNVKGDNNLSAGVAVKDGKMYYHPDVTGYRIAVGSDVFGSLIDGVDERVFSDSTTQDFSFNAVASTVSSSVSLGTFTANFIAQRKLPAQYREVSGIVRVNIIAPVPPNPTPAFTATFTPDNAADSDVSVVIYDTGSDNLNFYLRDGSNVKMLKNVLTCLPWWGNNGTQAAAMPNFVGQYEDSIRLHYNLNWTYGDYFDTRVAFRVLVRFPF